MDITDLDQLSPDEFDKKKRREKRAYLDKQPIYSKEDMLRFAQFVVQTIWASRTVKDDLEIWERDFKNSSKS